jgi:peptidoglycan/LPS O-acetylase OafA/YrhL
MELLGLMVAERSNGRVQYLPGLDGIRAIAVAAVVAYHLRAPHFDGGLLGVSMFFTLSGYLITSLLIRGFEQRGLGYLKTFWVRRAQRLLPALLLMLPVVGITTAAARPDKIASTVRQGLFSLLYVANWATIASGDDYFQRFSGPGPLDHLWSLSIEEQFYVAWPLVVFSLLVLGKRTQQGRRPLVLVTVLATAASTWVIFQLYHPNAVNNTRAYEGTDARVAALLVGALAAMALPFDRVQEVSQRGRVALDIGGAMGLAGVAAAILRTDEYSPFLYRGGELTLATATSVLAVAGSHPETLVARALGIAPAKWLGQRSYGVYLWHLPVVAFVPNAVFADLAVARCALQVGLILMLAEISYRLLENPVRDRELHRTSGGLLLRWLLLTPVATFALVVWPLSLHRSSEFEALAAEPAPAETMKPSKDDPPPRPTPEQITPETLSTACQKVVHVGDSTSIGLISRALLPNVNEQIAARYRAVGVQSVKLEIGGARAMVEQYKDEPNAMQIVWRTRATGYRGCWVLALGTNDPANVGGNAAQLGERIDKMMTMIGDSPVLWTTTKTLKDKGPYSNINMQGWNAAVVAACARHPNMRVYDWASEVEDDWFLPDGIHFNSGGYRERAQRFARALSHAFPKDGIRDSTCVVHATPAPARE